MEKSTTFSFHTLDDPADQVAGFPIFNNLLGINNEGLIAGFYGSGAPKDPNQGFLLTPSGTGTFTAVEFPGSAQTQLTGLNDKGIVVGYFYPTNNGTTVEIGRAHV